MAGITPEEAIVRAREALGLPALTTGKVLRVERLDEPTSAYYLVLLAFGGRDRHVALIDARTGALDQDAELIGAHPMLNMEQAIAISGLNHPSARLVWCPSRASFSPLYPIWEISTTRERRYVDQQGRLWHALQVSGRGGGS
jgi:hypothetical protein